MKTREWKWECVGRLTQVLLTSGDDLANLATLDRKHWLALSMPTSGVRFDARTLAFLDTDHDGRIRTPEILAAIDFLKSRNVSLDDVMRPNEDELAKKLADVRARAENLAKAEPSESDKQILAKWEADGRADTIAILGDATDAAEKIFAKVEPVIDAFFTPNDEMPLVTEEPDCVLPLCDHLNPKFMEDILAFAHACVEPLLGARTTLSRLEWKKIKAAFGPYRAWKAAKPVMNAGLAGQLEAEEREYCYRLHLGELLENFVNMKRLYANDERAIFQTGMLRIDAKEMSLCFHVDNEAAHAALSGKSKCCVLYVKLTRPSENATRQICAVVTAGAVAQLYVGRNGVFYDRDGKDWEAIITRVVENQVSLAEAFWSPWRKLGESVRAMVQKFLGDKQAAAQKNVSAGIQAPQANNNAAMASSVAAIGIGVGMMGTAVAALAAVVKGMGVWQILASILAVILAVSLPSVILTWFKLRQRDLGAILNACGWAVNRPMYFSMKRAREFTRCAKNPCALQICLALIVCLASVGASAWWIYRSVHG